MIKKRSLMKSKKYVIYAKKSFVLMKMRKMNLRYNVKSDHCHYTAKYGTAHSICNLRYKTPKEIPVVFDNGSTYDYH